MRCFNSKLVRLKDEQRMHPNEQGSNTRFNSKLVRLKARSASRAQRDLHLRFNSKLVRLKAARFRQYARAIAGFNSKLVRLKGY